MSVFSPVLLDLGYVVLFSVPVIVLYFVNIPIRSFLKRVLQQPTMSLKTTSVRVKITRLASRNPNPTSSGTPPAHHINGGREAFRNPWPSATAPEGLAAGLQAFRARFGKKPDFIPVPANREGLVGVQKPNWGSVDDPDGQKLKATWIGHASFLVETAAGGQNHALQDTSDSNTGTNGSLQGTKKERRGVRILCDPVFSDRTSPVKWAGPKRYTPPPCTVYDIPEVDCMIISHNHYDHLDLDTIKAVYLRQKGGVHFFCGLGNKQWFLSLGIGIKDEDVTELDWWDGVRMEVEGVGSIRLTCTPSQHFSARTLLDRNKTLWCSWVIEEEDEVSGVTSDSTQVRAQSATSRNLYFAGDTGYRHVSMPNPTPEEEASFPACPAFADIGNVFGPFDLALLPIGLCTPRDFMSSIHCTPEDSIFVHKDLKSKKSIGMHYGTVRGGISAYYEDVRDPPARWKAAAEKAGLKWGEEIALIDVGETVLVG